MSERVRGCGYRKIGGLYLTSDAGHVLLCDGLPLPLEPCGCCGFEPPFSRNLQRLNPYYITQAERKKHSTINVYELAEAIEKRDLSEVLRKHCRCPPDCPICGTMGNVGIYDKSLTEDERANLMKLLEENPFGLMFVGKKFYTPRSFIQEAENMGICKRIPQIPKWLRLGETWVLLAHYEVPKVSLEKLKTNEMLMKDPEKMKAIFYVFKPQRIEMPVWKGHLTEEEIQLLKKRGITPVILDPTPENKKKHGSVDDRHLMRLLQKEEEQGE